MGSAPHPVLLPRCPSGGSTRKHGVLSGDPTHTLSSKEGGNPVLHAHCTYHLGVSLLNKSRALSVMLKARSDAHRAKLVIGTTI